jgi:hypothetical protein
LTRVNEACYSLVNPLLRKEMWHLAALLVVPGQDEPT